MHITNRNLYILYQGLISWTGQKKINSLTVSFPKLIVCFLVKERRDCDARRADWSGEGELRVECVTAPRSQPWRSLSASAVWELRQRPVHHDLGSHHRCSLLCLWQKPGWKHPSEGPYRFQVDRCKHQSPQHNTVNTFILKENFFIQSFAVFSLFLLVIAFICSTLESTLCTVWLLEGAI